MPDSIRHPCLDRVITAPWIAGQAHYCPEISERWQLLVNVSLTRDPWSRAVRCPLLLQACVWAAKPRAGGL